MEAVSVSAYYACNPPLLHRVISPQVNTAIVANTNTLPRGCGAPPGIPGKALSAVVLVVSFHLRSLFPDYLSCSQPRGFRSMGFTRRVTSCEIAFQKKAFDKTYLHNRKICPLRYPEFSPTASIMFVAL